jgi:hypothetical protein
LTPERENQREGETASSTEKNLEKEEGETLLCGEFSFQSQKRTKGCFPLWPLYHNNGSLGGRK